MDNSTLEKLNDNLTSIQQFLESRWKDDGSAEEYKEILNECMEIIAGSKQVEDFFKDLSLRKLLNFGACETTWQFGDTAYKCKTCQLDPTSALCISCFKSGDHEGHDYSLQSVGGGFCDCGDPTSFKPQGFCSKHKEQKTDITNFPQRFILALCCCVQFILQKIYYFFEKVKVDEYEMFMEWLLKLAQRGDIVKVIVIKYISNTNIGNSHLLPPSPFPVPLLQLFFAPDPKEKKQESHKDTHRGHLRDTQKSQQRMKESFGNFCVFLRGSLEFIESFIRIILPIYKECVIYSTRHILLSSYSIFSSTAMSNLLLSEKAAEMVMDTCCEFFSKYFIERSSYYSSTNKVAMADPIYRFPQFKYLAYMPVIPSQLNTLRTDINYILSNPTVSSHIISNKESLSLWFNMVGISQGMNPNVSFMPIMSYDWITSFTLDIALSHSIFYIVNSIPLHKPTLDSLLEFSTFYLGKWMLGWIEFRNNYLVSKQKKLIEQQSKDKESQPPKQQLQLDNNSNHIINLKLDEKTFLNNFKEILSVFIQRDGFSFHLPLHRIVSSIIHRCFSNLSSEYATAGGLTKVFTQILGPNPLISVCDYGKASTFHPLSILAGLGQIKSGMWKSRGREEDMSLQAIMYQSLYYQKYYDLDIFLIQIGSMLMGSNEFIKHTLSIYQLEEYYKFEKDLSKLNNNNNNSQGPPSTPSKQSLRNSSGSIKVLIEPEGNTSSNNTTNPTNTTTTTTTVKEESKEEKKEKKEKAKREEELEKKKTLSEDYLQTIIMLSSNKILCGMNDNQIIRKEIIHRLCLADMTHSQLTRNIKSKYVNHPGFEGILKEIAVYHQPQKTEQGKYQLKEQCWTEFDSYFPHYNTQDLQTAEERYAEFVNKTKTNIARGLFIGYPTFSGFEPLNTLLCSKELHQILFTVLQNQLVASKKSSDTLLGHALNALELLIIQTLNSTIKNEDLDTMSLIIEKQSKDSNNSSILLTPSKSGSSKLNTSIEVIESFKDIPYPSQRNIFVNSIVQVQVSEQKKLSLLILLVKLTTSNQVNAEPKIQIQNIINCMMENNTICKQTVEGYLIAIKAKKITSGKGGKEDPEEEKKRIARARQAAILAQMKTKQQAFKFEDDEDDDDYEDDLSTNGTGNKQKKEDRKANSNALFVDGCESVTTCALCREAGSLIRPMGRVAFIQQSSILMLSKITPEERKERITTAVLKELAGSEEDIDKIDHKPSSGIHDLLGPEMDEDIEDVEMGSEDDEDTDDEVSKALTYLNKISQTNDFGDIGFPDDMNLDHDLDDEELMHLGINPRIVNLNQLMQPPPVNANHNNNNNNNTTNNNTNTTNSEDNMDDIFADEFNSDDEIDDDDSDDEREITLETLNRDGNNEIEIDFSSMDDDDDSDDLLDHDDSDDEIMFEDDSDDFEEYVPQQTSNQRNQRSQTNTANLMNFITQFVQDNITNQTDGNNSDKNNNITSNNNNTNDINVNVSPVQTSNNNNNNNTIQTSNTNTNANNNSNSTNITNALGSILDNIQFSTDSNNQPTITFGLQNSRNNTSTGSGAGVRRVMFRENDSDEEIIDLNDMDDDDDENPFFGSDDSEDENVIRKFDDTVEPVQGNPWSDKFSRQEIFRNTEESVNLHLSFCGHQIHEDCFSEYSWSVIKNNNFEGEDLIDPNKNEFLCVLCRRIGNAIVPVIPDSGFKNTNSIHTVESVTKDSQPGKPYQDFLSGLKNKLSPSKNSENDEPTPEAIKKVRPAIDQFASRIHGVRYDLNFYKSRSDSIVIPFLCSSMASTIADTELAIRTPDFDPQQQPLIEYPLFTLNDSHRIDLRSLYRVIVAHSFAHSPLPYEGKLLWSSISGSNAIQLPEDYDKVTAEEIFKESTNISNSQTSSTSNSNNNDKEEKKEISSKEARENREKEIERIDKENFPAFLSLDLFHCFVQVFIRYTDTDMHENLKKFYNVIRLFYDATLTQAILQHFKTFSTSNDQDDTDSYIKSINNFILNANESINAPQTVVIPPEHLFAIKLNSIIFLRKASLFLFACLRINPPTLTQQESQLLISSIDTEIIYLVNYLQLPTFKEHADQILTSLINHNDKYVPLVNTWSEQLLSTYKLYNDTVNNNNNNNSLIATTSTTTTTTTTTSNNQLQLINILPSPNIPKTFLLIKLPELYNALTQHYSSIPCIQCKTVSSTQALCLLCGTLCCLGSCCKRFFDQKNECIIHSERCNAGTCMFLVIKSSSILLVHLPRKTIWISPYLDDHGEEDINLRRGKPLFLNSNRYHQLNSLLLKHQIDQDSKIAELSSRDI